MENILEMSKALGDETRFNIYNYLARQEEPVSVRMLADEFKLHPNAIRQHLSKLLEAGLVLSELRRGLTGRPQYLYRRNPDLTVIPLIHRDYKLLSLLLFEFLADKKMSPGELRSFGKKWGHGFIKSKRISFGAKEMVSELANWGFEPELIDFSHSKIELKLKNCIFKEVARYQPKLVCNLVDGIIEGMLSLIYQNFTCKVTRDLAYGKKPCEVKILLQ